MIADWRKKMDLPDLSFFFVQLPSYKNDYSFLKKAQMEALKLPKVGYAVTLDLGDSYSQYRYMQYKQSLEIGRRLFLSCLNIQYA